MALVTNVLSLNEPLYPTNILGLTGDLLALFSVKSRVTWVLHVGPNVGKTSFFLQRIDTARDLGTA